MKKGTVLSRHRLPQPYRGLLIVFWLLPIGILLATLFLIKGMSGAFFDPRFLLILCLLALPALYIWQEGIDVLEDGLFTRIYVPRFHHYGVLDAWHLGDQPQRRVLTIWNEAGRKVLQCHAVHLTEFTVLEETLHQRLTYKTELH